MIRQFRADDAPACCSLIRECIGRDPQLSATLREKLCRSESTEAMIERAHLFYVAVYDLSGPIVAVGGLELNEIRLLYVSPGHQGKGFGKVLLEHLESMVPAMLFADIFVYSTFSAVDFYRTHGFAAGGEFAIDIGGEQLMTVFMTKPAAAQNRK